MSTARELIESVINEGEEYKATKSLGKLYDWMYSHYKGSGKPWMGLTLHMSPDIIATVSGAISAASKKGNFPVSDLEPLIKKKGYSGKALSNAMKVAEVTLDRSGFFELIKEEPKDLKSSGGIKVGEYRALPTALKYLKKPGVPAKKPLKQGTVVNITKLTQKPHGIVVSFQTKNSKEKGLTYSVNLAGDAGVKANLAGTKVSGFKE